MIRGILLGAALLMAIGLPACLPAPTPLPPLPTATPLPPSATPTPTVVWFPPTATFTPFPTVTQALTPTLDTRPQYGALILADDFSDPGPWTLSRTTTGSLAITLNELTVAVAEPGGYLFSLRQQPALTDFYAEITASPSLCRGPDEYGMLLRYSPAKDFYRFSLSCDGQVRLDRFYNGAASSPQPWQLSGAVPPGAPSSSRIAVLAVGKQMRFYVNDQFVFSVNDPAIPSGILGVFARSAGDTVVTVNFSDLKIYRPSQ
jgi:hypothetical protein